MHPKATNYKQRRGEWDTFYSTFFWRIHLDQSHPDNYVPMISGYSKKISESEAADKDYLFKKKILNLYTNGYFAKAQRIEFYFRVGEVIDKARDPKILVIYPNHYDIPPAYHDQIFKKFGVFLQDFFYRINNKKSMDGILPEARKVKSKDDYLNPDLRSFSTVYQLYAYATKLIKYGHAPGEVENFIGKVKEKYRWNV